MTATDQAESSHTNVAGQPCMVDVSAKKVTRRIATATGVIRMSLAATQSIHRNDGKKGSVIAVATVAAIQAAKRTYELVPLCHNLALDKVAVEFIVAEDKGEVRCQATVSTEARTGVEMEALVAVNVGLLTVYDMCKSIDASMEITSVRLLAKTGGKKNYATS